MIIGIPREIMQNESRVAALPDNVRAYIDAGFRVCVESGAGSDIFLTDDDYLGAGATIVPDARSLYAAAELVLKVKQPMFNDKAGAHEADLLREGALLVTFLHPAAPDNHEMVKMLQQRNITSFTMDSIPRTPRAQRMDALTSMSTVSGYKSVLSAANRLPRFMPMMGTACGTIQPATVLVIGAGVAGLQAIATARRLGATVEAVDIREEARIEAGSLKSTVVGFEVPAELAVGEEGYAKALPEEWLEKERTHLAPAVEHADIVILSTLVPGEMAPTLVTEEMVTAMKPGSVIVDISIDQGGNCALSRSGKEVVRHGVTVIATANIPGRVAVHASWLYANNMLEYVRNLFRNGPDTPELGDDIVRHSIVTHRGEILHEGTLKAMLTAPRHSSSASRHASSASPHASAA